MHFATGKVFKCIFICNYHYNSMRRDYCLKCTEIHCKELEFLAKAPKLGLDANPSFSDSKSLSLKFH